MAETYQSALIVRAFLSPNFQFQVHINQDFNRLGADAPNRLPNGGQRRVRESGRGQVVKAHHGDVIGYR